MHRTAPTNIPARRVKRGDSLTNLLGTVKSVDLHHGNVLITMTSGHKQYFGPSDPVTVNKPI
jgi:hypothetical protein